MEESYSIDEQIREYDKHTSSNLAGFIELVRKKVRGGELPLEYFHIGKTGGLLNKYGLFGDITANRRVLSDKRHSKDVFHNLSEELWLEVMESINDPLAICLYDGNSRFRVYTTAIIEGMNVCVGLNVNSVGRNILVSNISTVFGRKISRLGASTTEKLLYKKEAAGESSSGHNPQIYPQSPVSDAKV